MAKRMKFFSIVPGRVALVPESEGGKVVECLMSQFEPIVYDAICDLLPDGARCAEIGSFRGGSACIFSNGMARREKKFVLACHDVFEPFFVNGETHDIEKEFDAAVGEWGHSESAHKVKGDSKKTHAVHADGSLDYVFVDGDHSREGALADIENFYRALKPGGWLFVQDSTNEVLEAVNEFAGDRMRAHIPPPFAHHLTVYNDDAAKLREFMGRVDAAMKRFNSKHVPHETVIEFDDVEIRA